MDRGLGGFWQGWKVVVFGNADFLSMSGSGVKKQRFQKLVVE
jgi:hypothetical protein